MARKLRKHKRQAQITKTKEQETKITKVVEDNSVALERMKNVSSTCDKLLQKLNNLKPEPEMKAATVSEPLYMSLEPAPELEEPEGDKEKDEKENE